MIFYWNYSSLSPMKSRPAPSPSRNSEAFSVSVSLSLPLSLSLSLTLTSLVKSQDPGLVNSLRLHPKWLMC